MLNGLSLNFAFRGMANTRMTEDMTTFAATANKGDSHGRIDLMERLRAGDPELIGPWQIINRLGSGGMGIVYMGTNGTHAAAVKVVRDFLLEDPASRTRIAREVETLQRVKSEFVAEIVGSDVNGNPAWIATDYVDGPSLKTLVENEGPLRHDEWITFAKGFLSSVAAVHSVGVVHRDIKPSNILISKTGPKLIDFGISFTNDATSLTGTGMVAGTPAWLAPEQFLGREITVAVDNFAAGSTLMYAATGRVPWGAEDSSVGAVMHTILVEEPDTSMLTEFQIELITPLLIKDAASRKTASQILKRLNDGPRGGMKIATASKKPDSAPSETFLDKARKKDAGDKRRKEEEQAKSERDRIEAEAQAAARRQKEDEKEAKRLAKQKTADDAKAAKQKAADDAKAAKAAKLLGSSESNDSAETTNYPSGKAQPKIFVIAGLVIAGVVGGLFVLTSGGSGESGSQGPTTEKPVSYSWSALIAGESESQSGPGTTFEAFVCDQGVVAKSLRVESISTRPPSAGPLTVKAIKGEERCGKDFDTIVVSGKEVEGTGSVNYFVTGTTESKYEFRYDFTVTIVPK
jgi:serine/threonine protein kinase